MVRESVKEMKQYTTPEQTAKLIDLGFEKPTMKNIPTPKGEVNEEWYSIGELLSFLPDNVAKENEIPSTLNISLMNNEWCVQYADFLGTDFEFCNTELIDALYDMILRLKEREVI